MARSPLFASLAGALLLAAPVVIASAAQCHHVYGTLEETAASPCASPVDICTTSQLSGKLKGSASFIGSSVIPSADTPTTGVIFVTGDTTMTDVHFAGRRGTLLLKDAAAYQTTGNGDIVDLQVIVGGTGGFAGATGTLRLSGFFANGSGQSEFEGTVCLQ
jgi:hypothetical protein